MSKDNKKIKIPEIVLEFAKADFKKYKKKNKKKSSFALSKKDLRDGFYTELMVGLPDVIDWLVYYSYIDDPDVNKCKEAIFAKLANTDFIKAITKEIKSGTKIKNSKLLPIVLKDMLDKIAAINAERLNENPEAEVYQTEDLIKLSKLTMKKPLKKLIKAGIDPDMAYDILSVLPTEEVLCAHNHKHIYRYHIFFQTLYEIAKTKAVPFGKIMEVLIDEDKYLLFSMFALTEKKEKFSRLTESQKILWSDISEWSLSIVEGASRSEIKDFVVNYVNTRKRDEARGRDGLRRFQLSALSEADYPNLAAVIQKLKIKDPSIEKYV